MREEERDKEREAKEYNMEVLFVDLTAVVYQI